MHTNFQFNGDYHSTRVGTEHRKKTKWGHRNKIIKVSYRYRKQCLKKKKISLSSCQLNVSSIPSMEELTVNLRTTQWLCSFGLITVKEFSCMLKLTVQKTLNNLGYTVFFLINFFCLYQNPTVTFLVLWFRFRIFKVKKSLTDADGTNIPRYINHMFYQTF